MLQPFIWMFTTENFKKHFVYLFSYSVVFCVLTIITAILMFSETLPTYSRYICGLAGVILLLIPVLLTIGYFWNLTQQIISREEDISANSIYNGKIKHIYKIELPEFKFFQHLWRGIASIVANILLVIPYLYMIYLNTFSGSYSQTGPLVILAATIFYVLFCPALLWNYAKNNSVVSVLNIFKAINITGNYTLRYIRCIFMFIITYIVIALTDLLLYNFVRPFMHENLNIFEIIVCLLSAIIFIAKYLYFLYVNAYILGTITPVDES